MPGPIESNDRRDHRLRGPIGTLLGQSTQAGVEEVSGERS
jgi:hypothetical protein